MAVPSSPPDTSAGCAGDGNGLDYRMPLAACPSCAAPLAASAAACPRCGAVTARGRPLTTVGVVGFALGACALLIAWIPLVGLLSLPLSLSGAALSIIAGLMCLAGARRGIGWPIGGALVCGTAVLAVALMTMAPAVAVVAGAAAVSGSPPPHGAPVRPPTPVPAR